MYTIKHAAERVGVSDSTLRAWERRYGLDLARRTRSGYRLYDDAAVRLLRLTHELVQAGWPAREAAEEVRRRSERPDEVLPGGDPAVLVHLASEYDVTGLADVLDRHFGTTTFEAVIDGWLMPALCELGQAWDTGRITVAGEHMVAHGVSRRLAAEYDAARVATGPRVVIGLPPGSRHDLGLLAFATAARRCGLDTTYLGADVPDDAGPPRPATPGSWRPCWPRRHPKTSPRWPSQSRP